MQDHDRDAVNRAIMGSRRIVRGYSRTSGLEPPEQVALAQVSDEVRGRPILDLGVGGGRTVAPLRELSQDYLGVDYSEAMVAACRRLYPSVRFEHGDARDLRMLKDGSIFLALFSCNGLGMVGHHDRLRILKEVRRVLMPGGIFLFSTHNVGSSEAHARFRLPAAELALNPARLAVRLLRFGRSTVTRVYNRRRFAKLVEHGAGYSIINAECHDYGTMLYYVDLAEQRRQLREAGFADDVAMWDLAGKPCDDRAKDDSIMVLTRVPR
jgi:SAM-dependent methyltransferase